MIDLGAEGVMMATSNYQLPTTNYLHHPHLLDAGGAEGDALLAVKDLTGNA